MGRSFRTVLLLRHDYDYDKEVLMDFVDQIWSGKYILKSQLLTDLQSLYDKYVVEFSSFKEDVKRFQFVDKYFTTTDPYHNVPVVRKSAEISVALRVKGNDYYKEKKFSDSLRAYNLSLCFSPTGSTEYYLSIANRSAISFVRGQYDLCKLDIMTVIQSTIDSKEITQLKAKLQNRLEKCDQNLEPNEYKKQNVQVLEYFQLKNPSISVPSAEDFVDIRKSEKKGRHMVTTKSVPPGTVLVVEDPFAKVLLDEFRWSVNHCHSCLNPILNGIPCDTCVFAIFCSLPCEEAHDHYMCQVSSHLHSLAPSRTLILATKIITQQGPEKLFDFFLSSPFTDEAMKKTKGFTNGKYLSNSYQTIFNLIYHDASPPELFQYSLQAFAVTEALWKFSSFFNSHRDLDFKSFIFSLIILHLRNLPPNAHSVNELHAFDLLEYGAGAYSVLSLINHSCDPNVTRFNLPNGKVAVVTIKTIDSSELLDNYGAHYAVMPLAERRKHLSEYYNFACDCEPCQFDWPLFTILQESYNQNSSSSSLCINTVNQLSDSCYKNEKKFESLFQKVMIGEEIDAKELIECLQFFESNFKLPFAKFNEAQEAFKHYINAAIKKILIRD